MCSWLLVVVSSYSLELLSCCSLSLSVFLCVVCCGYYLRLFLLLSFSCYSIQRQSALNKSHVKDLKGDKERVELREPQNMYVHNQQQQHTQRVQSQRRTEPMENLICRRRQNCSLWWNKFEYENKNNCSNEWMKCVRQRCLLWAKQAI